MIAECVKAFRDKTTGEMRNVGDRFEVDSGRFAAINATKYGTLVREAEGGAESADDTKNDKETATAEKTPKRATRGRRKTTKE